MFVSQSHQVGPEDVKVEEVAPGAEAKSKATPPPSGALHNPGPDSRRHDNGRMQSSEGQICVWQACSSEPIAG